LRVAGKPTCAIALIAEWKGASGAGIGPGFAEGHTLRAAPGDLRRQALGARHAACAWGSYAWPDASAGGYMRSSKAQFKVHQRRVKLEQYTWHNRRAPTESEARLWEVLRGSKLGVQFRRQVPLASRYIVDFFAPEVRLVVEVDGGYHSRRTHADGRRDRDLRLLGYSVVRIPAALVTSDLPSALELIAFVLG
jgi:very-short-patch-repair endonuclease